MSAAGRRDRILLGDWSLLVRDPLAEWSSDHVFGSKLQTGENDTVGDPVADACGAAAGGVLLVIWAAFGWAPSRARSRAGLADLCATIVTKR